MKRMKNSENLDYHINKTKSEYKDSSFEKFSPMISNEPKFTFLQSQINKKNEIFTLDDNNNSTEGLYF